MSAAQIAHPDTKTDNAGNLFHPHSAIEGLWVADAEQRLDFLPTYFSSAFMNFESAIFNIARTTFPGYSGGFWEYALTDSGLPLVYLAYRSTDDANARQTVSNMFQDEFQELQPVLAGVITTMVAAIAMIQSADKLDLSDSEEQWFYDLHINLRDYGLELGKKLGNEQDRTFFKLVD